MSWCAKKQPTVARSSTEVEYRAVAQTAADVTWIQTLLLELGEHASVPPIIWCDNMSALASAANPVYHARTKHVEIDYHFIRENVPSKQIQIQHVGTQDQVADIFTNFVCSSFSFAQRQTHGC